MTIRSRGACRSNGLGPAVLVAALLAGCAATDPQADRPEPPSRASARAAASAAGEEDPQWTYGAVRGTVANLKRDGAVVIRVAVGRKSVEFLVPAKSPKAKELASLLGRQVEAEGRMEMAKGGERVLVAMEIAEVEAGEPR